MITTIQNKTKNNALNSDGLKILHIITKLELGGAQKNTIFTVEHLQQKCRTDLLCGSGGMLDDCAKKKITNIYFIKELIREINIVKDIKAFFKIFNYIKKNNFNIVHTHSSKAGILGRTAAKLAGVKIIIHTVHGWSFNDTQKFYIKYLYIILEKIVSLFTNKIISVSKECIKYGIKYGIGDISKYELIHSGVDYNEIIELSNKNSEFLNFKNKFFLNSNEILIGSISCFKPQKNLIDILNIAKIVVNQIPDIKFIIVGDGVQRKYFENKIIEYNLSDKVILTGWLQNPYILLKQFKLFLLTSLWEGLPRVFIESIILEIPILTYHIQGATEVIINNVTGYIFEKYDFEQMSEKIIELLNDDSKLAKIKTNISNFKKNMPKDFEINIMADKISKLYSKILSSGKLLCTLKVCKF